MKGESGHARHFSLCEKIKITDLSFCTGRPGAVKNKVSGVQKENH
jgi:hypothetical protein